ncbi:MAG: hydrogenase nickel incorporation protein HypB, partial [Acidobacteriota bacterium]|nr:hydrogenase nickel incorporation protein HypB [Acidobacteriota bacterium]
MTTTPRVLEIRQRVLSKNDELARALRSRFRSHGLLTLNLVSSPGTGKTRLLEDTLSRLIARGLRPAALVGDLATENDADRLRRSGAPVRQITTQGRCHLEAEMIAGHLEGWSLADIDILFIENVGNLVCPSSYDLGEDIRVVLLSVTEGEDKPLKYPSLFNSADLALITKLDLAGPCETDLAAMRANLEAVRPGMRVFETSAKTGAGVE